MTLSIRPATPDDVATIFHFSQLLSEYEKLAHEMVGTQEDLHRALFGERPYVEAFVAQWDDGKNERGNDNVVASATYFYNFSTFLMKPGIYLEDLFVLPEYRRKGIATALLKHLANHAITQGCGRFEWSVLDWNVDAIAVYKKMGAVLMDDWTVCRVDGDALVKLAAQS
ncbi:MAG: GNAT family N-acetyltransferase [Cyanobacteria bacterium P01_F01_bin.3]